MYVSRLNQCHFCHTSHATDTEIHDAVLITAAFCMFNRYLDGLGTWAPENREDYAETGEMIVEFGYAASTPQQS